MPPFFCLYASNYGRLFAQTDYGIAWDNENDSAGSDDSPSLTAGASARMSSLLGTLELSYPLSRPE